MAGACSGGADLGQDITVRRGQGKRGEGLKAATQGLTVYLLPEEHKRLRQLALDVDAPPLAVELVEHCNDVHPTLIFHAAAFHTLTSRHEDAVVGVPVLAGCGLLIEIATARATARFFPWYRKSSG